jgi:hypothetical protein
VAPRVLHISPAQPIRPRQRDELARLFAGDVEVAPLSPLGMSPAELVELVQQSDANAVIAGGGPAHLEALAALAGERVILRPIEDEVSTPRGVERRFGSYGRLSPEGKTDPLGDGALRP